MSGGRYIAIEVDSLEELKALIESAAARAIARVQESRPKAKAVRRSIREILKNRPGEIYFIRMGQDGPIKIGFSGNVATRFAGLQIGCPHELSLLGRMPGGLDDERRLHARFDALRIRGEWFRPEPELLAFIASETRT